MSKRTPKPSKDTANEGGAEQQETAAKPKTASFAKHALVAVISAIVSSSITVLLLRETTSPTCSNDGDLVVDTLLGAGLEKDTVPQKATDGTLSLDVAVQPYVSPVHQWGVPLKTQWSQYGVSTLKGINHVPAAYESAYLAPYKTYWAPASAGNTPNSFSTGDKTARLYDTFYSVLYLIWRRASDILQPSSNPDAKKWPTAQNIGNFFRFVPVSLRITIRLLNLICAAGGTTAPPTTQSEDNFALMRQKLICGSGASSMRTHLMNMQEKSADLLAEATEFAHVHVFAVTGSGAHLRRLFSERRFVEVDENAFEEAGKRTLGVSLEEIPEMHGGVLEVLKLYTTEVMNLFDPYSVWDADARFYNDVMGFRQAMWNYIHTLAEYSAKDALFQHPHDLISYLDSYVEYNHPCPICRAHWRDDGPALFGRIETMDDVRIGIWLHHNDANMRIQSGMKNFAKSAGAPLVEFFSTDKRWPSCDMCPSCWAKGLCDGKSVGGAANADDHVNAALFKAQFNETEILRFLADVYS